MDSQMDSQGVRQGGVPVGRRAASRRVVKGGWGVGVNEEKERERERERSLLTINGSLTVGKYNASFG